MTAHAQKPRFRLPAKRTSPFKSAGASVQSTTGSLGVHISGIKAGYTMFRCATSRKVAGSIPDDVIEIFHLHNPSVRTMALGLTQPLTEMSTRNISWG